MISVAIAAYNGARYIEKQLESILNQTCRADEVIICDDRSSDNTAEICEKFIEKHNLDNWRVFVNEKNIGFCLNFYGAIEKCGGDIIFLADQDDEWLPERIKIMTQTLENHPEVSVLSARYDVIDENSETIENSGVTYLGEPSKFDGSIEYISAQSLIGCSYIRGFSICMRKSIVPLIRKIDLKSLLAHDWLIAMLGCVSGKTGILNTVLTHYRYHRDNVSLSAMNRENRRREKEKRILGLRESVAGHEYVSSLAKDTELKKEIDGFIIFENRRIAFLESKSIFAWLRLGICLRQYGRYYKDSGLRVWLGDLAYAFKK